MNNQCIANTLSGTNFKTLQCTDLLARCQLLINNREHFHSDFLFYRENMTSFLNYVTGTLGPFLRDLDQ